MTANIHVTGWQAWFEVETDHPTDRLEFVLRDAAERASKEYDLYWVELGKSLNHACGKVGAEIAEDQAYGSISFLVCADDQMTLQNGLAACELAVQAWMNKYNVNKMKA